MGSLPDRENLAYAMEFIPLRQQLLNLDQPMSLDKSAPSAVEHSDGATMFTAWIYDHLKPHVFALKAAHSLVLIAIAAANK